MRILLSLMITLLTIQCIAQPVELKSSLTLGYLSPKSIAAVSKITVARLEPTSIASAARAVYAELGGSGGFLSVNYDTRFNKTNKGLGLRIGIGTITDANSFGLTVPFGLNYIVGEKDPSGAGCSILHPSGAGLLQVAGMMGRHVFSFTLAQDATPFHLAQDAPIWRRMLHLAQDVLHLAQNAFRRWNEAWLCA